ncbi:MAG: hypothetical protein COV31_03115 [Candidatus Yanofskybacteria bacterium CG10_big_fil_rev_8_21_14_0_10_46_23]|uniref:Uncharacterized protein n=1 Tax=Candidatus Yanofskybacteria bacterium CG10_big_fil_rev_8_21_14_0_10_46_23 TaxID=1975098 RepID=A0A2H0R481_9BACT|nr:MAG: hypothetical protein COV31_03115 [Candidatus Yanofskybacteria bacterium CG10_big_fil_rev_8_21_14_0_10_46_23]
MPQIIEPNLNPEAKIDAYIQSRIQEIGCSHGEIEPSLRFVEKTMRRVQRVQRQQDLLRDFYFVLLALLPFILYQIWMSLRRDYFSVSEMPFGQIISQIYGYALAPVATFVVFSLSLFLVMAYLIRTKAIFESAFIRRFRRHPETL